MRKIEITKKFKKDYKRLSAGSHGANLNNLLQWAVDLLAADEPLPWRCHDHALTGDWTDHRDCHLKPDLLLIYRKPDTETLELVRLGSHSDLGL
ncbi:MAG: type II toxin-antitoxin system YafQ family toxin [Rhodomicrobium sp.]